MLRQSIKSTLLILTIFLMMICGTGAVYVDKKQEEIKVNSANIGLKVSEPVFYSFPEEISNDSEIDFSVNVENTGSVPVYLSENITYEINHRFDSANIIIEKAVSETGSEILDSDDMLGSKETTDILYRIRFSGVQEIPEGSISINGSIKYTASTSPDGSFGFVTEPETVNINIEDLKLYSDNSEEYAMVKDNTTDNDKEIHESFDVTTESTADNYEKTAESIDMATESTLNRISGEYISTASEIEENGMD